MATINGTFNSLIGGTISGTVGTPGPQGPAGPAGSQGIPGVGVPVGGNAGQVLAKVDGVSYNTHWIDQSAPDFISSVSAPLAVTSGNLTVNLAGYATETFVTSQGYITSAALSPYLLSSTAASTYQTIAGMAGYAQLSGATFTGNVFAPTPSPGTDSTRIATTEWVKDFDYAPTNSPTLTGNPKSVTPNLSDDDTSIATTAFVKGQGYLTSSALSGYALLSGATFTGKVNFTPVGGVAGLNVGIGGTAVSSPTAGDLWIATGGSVLNYRDGTSVHRLVATQNLTNTFSSPQIIDTTNASAALRVTQKGTGNALEVEDSTSPDSTRFVVDQHGKVGIGVAPDANAALKVDGGGIMFGDGTRQFSAAAAVSLLKPQIVFGSSLEVPSTYNNYMLTLETSDGTEKGVTFGSLPVGSNVTFIQGGTDRIVFATSNAFQNKLASAGQNAVITANSTNSGWFLEGDLDYIPAGYVISSSCVFHSGSDALGVTWDGYYYSEAVVANGSGGTTSTSTPNANGCWYPNGYAISIGAPYNQQNLSWEVVDNYSTIQASGTFEYYYQFDIEYADGAGGSNPSSSSYQAFNGQEIANGSYPDQFNPIYWYYYVYSDGFSGYYVTQNN